MQIPNSLVNQFISNPIFKTDTRAIFFLLQNPEPVSSDDIAAATGLSRKCANKAVKRLSGAGLIQPGEIESRKRTFDVTGWEPVEPQTATEGTIKESLETLAEKVGRLESVIGSLTTALEVVLNPASSYNGQNMTKTDHIPSTANPDSTIDVIEHGANVTQAMTFPAHIEPSENIQSIMSPVNDTERTKALWVITEQGTNEPQKDTITDDLDTALIRARGLLAAKQASLLKEKQQQPGAHASIGDEFKALFGVQLPSGSDQAAATVMIARKKAGKLDNVKSPMGYLNSLAGKVQSPIVTSSVQLPPVQVTTIHSVIDTSLDDYEQRSKIKAAWFGLNAEQRIPFHELREKKAMSGMPGGKVPVELLAFQQFTQECLAGRVQI